MLHVWQGFCAAWHFDLHDSTLHHPCTCVLSAAPELLSMRFCKSNFSCDMVLLRDQRARQRLIEGLPQPGGRSKIGPMAAKKLIGLLTAEDPMTAMDSFAA